MDVAAAAAGAPEVLLRKALDAQKSQAQALLQSLPPVAAVAPAKGKGSNVDVYA